MAQIAMVFATLLQMEDERDMILMESFVLYHVSDGVMHCENTNIGLK